MITVKGRARRDLLLDAVVSIIAENGTGGVTHRAVAARAGVPTSAATYYFATLDELVSSALVRSTADQIALFETIGRDDTRPFAKALHHWAIVEPAAAIAQYELLFLAMRSGTLDDAVRSWYDALETAVAALGFDATRTRHVSIAIDGLALRMLTRGDPDTVTEVATVLDEILSATSSSSA